MNNITISDIKNNNYSLIYRVLYEEDKLTKQDIANRLHLSLPTVTQNLFRLQNEGFIEKGEQFKSQVGRKAAAYSLCTQARIAIGVEILEEQICILAIDLRGNIISSEVHFLIYEHVDSYYQTLAQLIKNYIKSLFCTSEQILGIGFAVQELTSGDGSKITYDKTLGYTDVNISIISQYLNHSCIFCHSTKCAAATELWHRNDLTNAVYLSIDKHLGGALIINGHVVIGKNGHSGSVGHMTLVPSGRPCYCGKNGCLEAYCSTNALLNNEETLDYFFEKVRNENPEYIIRWKQFLHMLTTAITNFHIVYDCKIILGGHMASYLNNDDLKFLNNHIRERSIFPDLENYVQICRILEHSVPIGAALPYVVDFLNIMIHL